MFDTKFFTKKQLFLQKPFGLAWLLVIAGCIGLAASFILSVDTFKVLQNPSTNLACNLNPLINCGSLMNEPESHVIFDVPNPLFGVVGFMVVTMTGVVMLFGAQLSKLYWRLFNAGMALGVVSIGWFFYQSVYHLGHLCIFCMTVWVMTIIVFWYTTLWNIEHKTFSTPKRLKKTVGFTRAHHADILVVVYLAMLAAIVQHFWYYFKTL